VSRMPWLTAAFVLVPVIVLVLAGQTPAGAHDHHAGGVSVDQLTGSRDRTPDVRLTMTATRSKGALASGHTVDALTFNGVAPGPEIRVKLSQLVEVTLVNTDVEEGTHREGWPQAAGTTSPSRCRTAR
jgi:FtsP/CotA-like multicopper oxidase with cupredoxin domain